MNIVYAKYVDIEPSRIIYKRMESLVNGIRTTPNVIVIISMKVFIALTAFVAVAVAIPAHPAPSPSYHPAPSYKEKELPPQPFSYNYGVRDEYTGTDFDKQEEQDAYGNLQGEYRVALPDGRTQIVSYRADHENGFVADVSYEGEAQYPPEPKEGYGYKPAPKYAPAPSYN